MESATIENRVAEARMAELTAELLTLTEEVQFEKVLPTAVSCMWHVIHMCVSKWFVLFFFTIQNKAETALAENSAMKTACQAAEKAEEESREKSKMAEVSDFN